LKSRSKSEYNGDVTEEFRGSNKRLVTNSNEGVFTVIVEGTDNFVGEVRKKLKGLK
jgi:hypothetical protein